MRWLVVVLQKKLMLESKFQGARYLCVSLRHTYLTKTATRNTKVDGEDTHPSTIKARWRARKKEDPPPAFNLFLPTTLQHNLPILYFTMKSLLVLAHLLLVTLLLPCSSSAFQFMSKWKLPTHDPNRERIQDRFGDKSMLLF